MNKIIYIILIFSVFHFYSAQTKLQSDFVATYNVEYPIYGKKNTEQFLLFMDTKSNKSFYKSTNQYVLDSLKAEGKILNDDFTTSMNYKTALSEQVIKEDNFLTVFDKIINAKIKYQQNNAISWTILNDKRIYSGYSTRKAYANVFGRKWIAWYAEEMPLSFGPYKFNGLPGLIVNLYDEKAEYFFTLSQLKSKKMSVNLPNSKNFKSVPKKDIRKLKYNIYTDVDNSGRIFNDINEKKEAVEKIRKRLSQMPELDIE